MDATVDLGNLAIFPLPHALLFPHAVLPLHVFEPRYRQLVEDALANGRTMAIACLDEARTDGHVRALVGVGAIVAHEPMPDGRSNILLRGIGRARIDGEIAAPAGRQYRVVRAHWQKDDALDGDRDEAVRQTLVALASQLAHKLPEGGATLRALVESQPDAGSLSDLLCAALVTEPAQRLRLFETLDVTARADGVAEAIGIALATLGIDDGTAN